jgi:hypothetical protein
VPRCSLMNEGICRVLCILQTESIFFVVFVAMPIFVNMFGCVMGIQIHRVVTNISVYVSKGLVSGP